MEQLRVSLGVLLLVDEQLTGNHDENISVLRGRLGVQCGDSVAHLGEWQAGQLLNDGLGALDLVRLERKHRVVTVQVSELLSVLVELVVVEGAELLCESVEVNRHEEESR